MTTEEAIEKIDEKISRIALLRSKPRFSPEYEKWHRETKVLLQKIFGKEAYQLSDFTSISFVYRGIHVIGDEAPFERR